MRRRTGIILSALGAFLVVFALLIRFVVAPSVVEFPLNEYSVSTAVAQDANYFSVSKLSELTGVTLQDTVTVKGDSAAGTSSRAVWNEFSYLKDETDNLRVEYSQESMAFERKSGDLFNCCGTSVGTNGAAHVSGLGFVWPIGSQKKTYEYFDTTLLKPEPAVYEGTAVIDGLTTYKYVEKVAPTQSGKETLPGSLVGLNTSKNVTLPEYYQGMSTFYVDPTVGAPVMETIDEHLYLVDNGTEVLNLMDGDFSTTPASVSSAVSSANTRDTEVELVRVILPLVIGLVGLVLLIVGLVLGWPARRRDDEADEEEAGYGPPGDSEYEPRHGAGEVTA